MDSSFIRMRLYQKSTQIFSVRIRKKLLCYTVHQKINEKYFMLKRVKA